METNNTINLEEVKPLLGKTFKDTLIYDPVLGSCFIIKYSDGGWGVMKTRRDGNGNLRWSVLGYPSTFANCLNKIAQSQLNEEGAIFDSIQKYIDAWKQVSDRILNAYKNITV